MNEQCRCGDVIRHAYESWTCARCACACCPSCADRDGARATCLTCRRGEAEAAA